MHQSLLGKVAYITGTAGGIGRAVAERFLAEGCKVVGLDRSKSDVKSADDAFASIEGDVRSSVDHQHAVDIAVARYGGLDIFVGNAGLYDNRAAFKDFTPETLDTAFDEMFGVNVKGYMLGALASIDALGERRGAIIFTSSISGMNAGFGGALYVAAKHAVTGLTKQLAFELAPNIRVNAVAPGYVQTKLRGLSTLPHADSNERSAREMPLEVLGTAADFAEAYVFLASDACARIASGSILSLDGGAALRGPGSVPVRS